MTKNDDLISDNYFLLTYMIDMKMIIHFVLCHLFCCYSQTEEILEFIVQDFWTF